MVNIRQLMMTALFTAGGFASIAQTIQEEKPSVTTTKKASVVPLPQQQPASAAPAVEQVGIVSYDNAIVCDDVSTFIYQAGGPSPYYQYSMHLKVGATGATSYRWGKISGSNHVIWEDRGNGVVQVASKQSTGGLTLQVTASGPGGSSTKYYFFNGPAVGCPMLTNK